MENIVIPQDLDVYGMATLIILYVFDKLWQWLIVSPKAEKAKVKTETSRKAIEDIRNDVCAMGSDMKALQVKTNNIESAIETINVRTEHNSFIPAFGVKMSNAKESILSACRYDDNNLDLIVTEVIDRIIDIFQGIMSQGYHNYNERTLEQNFDRYKLKLTSMIDAGEFSFPTEEVLEIIQKQQSLFFIGIPPVLKMTNGIRQDAYIKLCEKALGEIAVDMQRFN